MQFPAEFDGRRLRRHAWTVPFKLAFAPVALAAVGILAPIVLSYPTAVVTDPLGVALYLADRIGAVPLCIAAFFAVCGLMWGLGFGASASKVLAVELGVRELDDHHPLAQRVHQVAAALNLPPPRVGVMPRTVNAYAIGTSAKDSAVVLGLPLVHGLAPDELDAVIGHELGHIVSGDMRRMQMAAGFQSMLDTLIGNAAKAGAEIGAKQSRNALAGLVIFLFGQALRLTVFLVSELLVKNLSRSREYVADAFGALAATPQAMASALEKLKTLSPSSAAIAKQHQCLMFWNSGGSVFATHPTLDRRLASLARGKHAARLLAKGCGTRRAQAMARTQRMAARGAGYASALHGAGHRAIADPAHRARLRSAVDSTHDFADRHLLALCAAAAALGMAVVYVIA